MSAFVLVDFEVHDPELMKDYMPIAAAALRAHGGKVIVRDNPEAMEGDWNIKRLVMVEFPTLEGARAWFNSPEYAPALAIRRRAATARVLLFEKLDG